MTVPKQHEELPVALIDQSRRLSLVWLIPLIAALIGAWLVVKTLSEKGPTITIMFSHAEGIEVGKTRVRFKDVDVGKVKDIELGENLEHVIITVEMKKSLSGHLNQNTRFWIVRPRISTSGISGLSTLVSGIYIAMDPGDGKTRKQHFVGLEEPARVISSAEGQHYVLLADSLGSLDVGAPVYYREVQVGEITDFQLARDGQNVAIGVYVNAPYDRFVHDNSRFWNVSGFSVDLTANGINAQLESLTSLLIGGVAFETPANLAAAAASPAGKTFMLYADHASIDEKPPAQKKLFVMNFKGSLRGLSVNAPVEFRGIKVGKVLNIDLRMDPKTVDITLPVLVELYPERVSVAPPNDSATAHSESVDEVLNTLVERGLRAKLSSGNLLTGQLFIDLDFVEDAPRTSIQLAKPYSEFPTVPTRFEELARTASGLLAKIDQMPLLEISQDLRASVQALKTLTTAPATKQSLQDVAKILKQVNSLSEQVDHRFDPLVSQLQSTLKQFDKTLGEDSPLLYELRQLIGELDKAASSFESLTDYLQRHPDALIRGKTESPR